MSPDIPVGRAAAGLMTYAAGIMVAWPSRTPHQADGRRTFRVAAWLLGSAAGAAVIALPDSDDRVVSISQTHGPSLVDLIGMIIVLVAWLPVVALLWSHRALLRGRAARLAAWLVVVGTVLLVITIGYDLGPIWLLPVVLLVVAQLLAVAVITRRT